MADHSLSDVKVTLGGVTYTLRGSIAAYHAIEQRHNVLWFDVVGKVGQTMRIQEVADLFCGFALDNHPDLKALDLVAAMGDLAGFRDAVQAMQAAVAASIPKAEPGDAGAGADAAENPTQP